GVPSPPPCAAKNSARRRRSDLGCHRAGRCPGPAPGGGPNGRCLVLRAGDPRRRTADRSYDRPGTGKGSLGRVAAMAFDRAESYTPGLDLRAGFMASRRTVVSIAGFSVLLFSGASQASPPPVSPPISGIVSHLEKPIAGVLVMSYNL